jgi:hypothetical protein
VSSSIDTVNPDVVQRPAAELLARSRVLLSHLHGEYRIEEPWFSDLSAPDELDRFEIRPFEVKTVSDHQSHVGSFAGGYHPPAFIFIRSHRFLAEDMDTSARRAHGDIGMHAVRQDDVGRIDGTTSEQAFVFVVVNGDGNSITLLQERELGFIVGH